MSDFNRNIWAPWRMEYIHQLNEPKGSCFLCTARDNPQDDEKNFVLKRGKHSFIILNRFPYSTGHMLIAPNVHSGDLNEINDETMLEMVQFLREMKHLLSCSIHAQGFNVGINIEHCAGAGLPDHLHVHIVPRWQGDTNFMSVLDSVRVIPEAIEKTYRKLKECMAGL